MMRLLRIAAVLLAGITVAAAATGAAAAPTAGRSVVLRSVDLGGAPLQLVSADGALWGLTCDSDGRTIGLFIILSILSPPPRAK